MHEILYLKRLLFNLEQSLPYSPWPHSELIIHFNSSPILHAHTQVLTCTYKCTLLFHYETRARQRYLDHEMSFAVLYSMVSLFQQQFFLTKKAVSLSMVGQTLSTMASDESQSAELTQGKKHVEGILWTSCKLNISFHRLFTGLHW